MKSTRGMQGMPSFRLFWAPTGALICVVQARDMRAAKRYGRLSGRCCSCGRDLTNEASIEAGIGPICATKF